MANPSFPLAEAKERGGGRFGLEHGSIHTRLPKTRGGEGQGESALTEHSPYLHPCSQRTLADLEGACSGPCLTPCPAPEPLAAHCGASGHDAQCPSHAAPTALGLCPLQPAHAEYALLDVKVISLLLHGRLTSACKLLMKQVDRWSSLLDRESK